jgi:hypothetical protein
MKKLGFSQSPTHLYKRQRFYNATSSLVRCDDKKCFLLLWKNASVYNSAGVVVVNSEVVGLDPVHIGVLRDTTPTCSHFDPSMENGQSFIQRQSKA